MKKLIVGSILATALLFSITPRFELENSIEYDGGVFITDTKESGPIFYPASYSDPISDEPSYVSQNSYTFSSMNFVNSHKYYRGETVKVAVIDSGLNYTHEDFIDTDSNQIIQGHSRTIDNKSGSWLYYQFDKGYQTRINDTLGHGTNVASVIASQINAIGCAGVAPNVELYVYKVTNSNDGYEWVAINSALQYCIDEGMDVVNMSFQAYEHAVSYGSSSMAASTGCSTVMVDKLNACYEAGITLVAAAGNFNTSEPSYPASNNHVISVGSLAESSTTTKAGYSNTYGIDLVAPGTVYVADKGYTNSYKKTQGTSFSSPIVTAAIALYKQTHKTATPAQIESALYASCDSISGNPGWAGNGRLNIDKFLGLNQDKPVEIVLNNPEIVDDCLELEAGTTFDLDWTVNGIGSFDDSVNFYTLYEQDDVLTVNSNGRITAVGEGEEAVIIESNVDPSIYASVIVTVTNSDPSVSSVDVSPSSLELDLNGIKSATLSAVVNGTNNPPQTVTWESSNDAIASVLSSGEVTAHSVGTTTITATSTFDSTKSGTCTVTVSTHRVVIEKTYAEGNITWPTSSTASIQGINGVNVTNGSNITYESGDKALRLGTNGGGGDIEIESESGYIASLKLNVKAYSSTKTGDLTVGEHTIAVNDYSNYHDTSVLEFENSSNTVNISTPNKNVRINIKRIDIKVCTSEEDIGTSEDCLGLETFISSKMHMDYTENLGYCSDSTHHYYATAKDAFNSLNDHQRSLFTSNSAYLNEWTRLSTWAAINGDSLTNDNKLSKSQYGLSTRVKEENNSTLIVIVIGVTSVLSLSILLILKKRKRSI